MTSYCVRGHEIIKSSKRKRRSVYCLTADLQVSHCLQASDPAHPMIDRRSVESRTTTTDRCRFIG